jgi:hypothetical protein
MDAGEAQSTRLAQAVSEGTENQGNDSRRRKSNTKNGNNMIGEVDKQTVSNHLQAGIAKHKRETMMERPECQVPIAIK